MPSHRLSAETKRDLAEIAAYTERHWGRTQRHRYLDRLDRRMALLAESPRLGSPRPEVMPELRSFREGSHLILYQEEADGVLILRILHVKMELRRWLTAKE